MNFIANLWLFVVVFAGYKNIGAFWILALAAIAVLIYMGLRTVVVAACI